MIRCMMTLEFRSGEGDAVSEIADLEKSLDESGLGSLFHATRCADEAHSKPHPQMLEEILTDLDTAPGRIVRAWTAGDVGPLDRAVGTLGPEIARDAAASPMTGPTVPHRPDCTARRSRRPGTSPARS